MTDERVERVAKALWLDDVLRHSPNADSDQWAIVYTYVKEDYRRHAQVAIQALEAK
jgi:hypothetical protein